MSDFTPTIATTDGLAIKTSTSKIRLATAVAMKAHQNIQIARRTSLDGPVSNGVAALRAR